MTTKSEIVWNWAKSIEGKFINEDGAYGSQCKDAISHFIRVIHKEPYTSGNGDVMAENLIAYRGWSTADQSKPLQPGDVVSFDTGGLGGHVFVVLENDGKTITYIDQNGGPKPADTGPDEACVIRTTTRRKWRKVARPRWDNVDLDDSPAVEAKPSSNTYTIKYGDTLWGISRAFRISVDELKAANPTVDSGNLRVGSKLKIPSGSTKTYTVRKGDSLSKIATTYGTTVKKLQILNPTVDPNLIFVGQTLIVG